MPPIPPQNRDINALHPKQRAAILKFIAAAKAKGWDVRIGETTRTKARQAYLFSCNTDQRWVTNCDGSRNVSMHQYCIATDLLLYKNGKLTWDNRDWRTLYATVPPSKYGLELIPQELCHVQLAGSQAQVQRNGKLNPDYMKRMGITLL